MLILGCEKQSDHLNLEETELANIRSSFDRASLSDKHTLWGASNKKIEWDNPQSIKRDSLATYIRVRVQDSISLGIKSGGENQFYQIWLKATKKVDNKNTYSLSYLTLITNEQADKFTGLIFSEDILNKATSYTTFVEGKAVRKNNKDILLKGSNKSYLSYECQHIWAIVNDSWHARQTCQWTVDPNRPITEEAFDPDGLEGGGASGGGGSDGPPLPPPPRIYKITNKITHPCMKSMVDDLIQEDISFAANKSLQSIFGIDGSYDLIFDQSTTLPNLTHGTAATIGGYWDNDQIVDLTVEIKLNLNSLAGSSREFIAMVIIHEATHAYLYAQGFVQNQTQMHHEQMWLNYTDFIANYLTNTYGTSSADAYALATTGLQKTFGSRISETIYNKITGYKGDLSEDRAVGAEKYRKGEKGTSCTSN